MTRVILVIREVGRLKPDFSLPFDLPEVPRVGDYISVTRPETGEIYSEDFVVRHIWWRLHFPDDAPYGDSDTKPGGVTEIMVECDPAIGPHSLDRWRDALTAAQQRGVEVEEFKVARLSVRQDELSGN